MDGRMDGKSNIYIELEAPPKKGDSQLLQNYWSVSLLPICGKIFERIIFNPIFKYLKKNSLLCPNQSGFHPFDSCENQLLSIVHDTYANFDQHPTLA